MHFYSALSIPKFREKTPIGVSKAEYDCLLENVDFIETKDFENIILSTSK